MSRISYKILRSIFTSLCALSCHAQSGVGMFGPISAQHLNGKPACSAIAMTDCIPATDAYGGLAINTNARSYGMVGDGTTDDSAAFASALAAAVGKTLHIPKPTVRYLIGPTAIPGNSTIHIDPGTVFMAKAGFTAQQNLIAITDVPNVTIIGYGSIFQMPKAEYSGSANHAIAIRGGSDIRIEGVAANDSGGDGFYIGTGSSVPLRVVLQSVSANNNRRQGLSLISGIDVTIRDSFFSNTTGADPQCGVDIEPNLTAESLKRILFDGIHTYNNSGCGFSVSLFHLDNTSPPVDIAIRNLHADSEPVSGIMSNCAWSTGTSGVGGVILFDRPLVSNSMFSVYWDRWYQSCPVVTFQDLHVVNSNPNINATVKTAVVIYRASGGGEKIGNVKFVRPVIRDTYTPTHLDDYFYYLDGTGLGVTKWTVEDPVLSGATNPFSMSRASTHPAYVASSATPVFYASMGGKFWMSLTSNVTSSTLVNAVAGQQLDFVLCQGAAAKTFVWPTTVLGGMTVGTTINKCSMQSFIFDGTTAHATSAGMPNQ